MTDKPNDVPATDKEIADMSAIMSRRHPHQLYHITNCELGRILARLSASEARVKELEAQLKPEQSDADVARQILNLIVLCPFKEDHDESTRIISAHVAPIRARVKTAEGLLWEVLQWNGDAVASYSEGQAVTRKIVNDKAREFLESSSTLTPGLKEGE